MYSILFFAISAHPAFLRRFSSSSLCSTELTFAGRYAVLTFGGKGVRVSKKLSADALVLSVDLSPCAVEGSYELPVQVTLPEGYELAADVTLTVVSTSHAVQTEGE